MDASALKAELKSWERDFQVKFSRKPTIQDIKKDPIAAKYKLHKQLSQRQPPLPSKSWPTPSQDGPSSSSANPFASPRKSKPAPDEPSSPNIFSGSYASNTSLPSINSTPANGKAILKARKRLRGEPVSPSPNKDIKKRRLLLGSNPGLNSTPPINDDTAMEGHDEDIQESPVKISTRHYLPLFEEQQSTSNNLFGTSRPSRDQALAWEGGKPTSATSISHKHNPSKQPPGADPFERPEPQSTLVPPVKDGAKPLAPLLDSDKAKGKQKAPPPQEVLPDLSDGEEVKVVEWQTPRKGNRRASAASSDGLDVQPAHLIEDIKPLEVEGTKLDILLPDELQRVLSLHDSQMEAKTRDTVEERLAEDLIRGRFIHTGKGDRAWGAGESAHEQRRESSEDEWDEAGAEWALGEL